MKNTKRERKGFTLLEILLVIAAIGILAAIVLVAINPNRQIAQARNAQRRSDINTIYKALEQYLIDNKTYPIGIGNTASPICNTGSKTTADTLDPTNLCDGKVDLRVLVPTYLSSIPKDPSGGVYEVYINSANNRIGVEAAGVELGQSIVLNPIVSATGGDITTINQNGIWYKVHTFLTSGTFEVTGGSLNVEYLIVGGGGGGGLRYGGGGGAGGFIIGISSTVTAQTYDVVVGAGGAGYTGSFTGSGASGSASSVFSLSAAGGGGGAAGEQSGLSGGSGGGGGRKQDFPPNGGTGNTPSTSPAQGTNGGSGGPGGSFFLGGGGGGATSEGGDATSTVAGNGGAGKSSNISGSWVTYAGGGGGASWIGFTAGTGGSGGGGNGVGNGSGSGFNGTNGLGGGGGGGNDQSGSGGNGGSGIVIIRYIIPAP